MLSAPDRRIVCYVTNGRDFLPAERGDLALENIHKALRAGADWIQIREKDVSAKPLLKLTRASVEMARLMSPAGRVFVNERLDVALAANAAGVHLGGNAIPRAEVVNWCRSENAPADFLIGVSCHSVLEVRAAETAGVDYAFFGPVFDTPSKRVFGAPQGLAKLAQVCSAVHIPVIAIGGIQPSNAGDCFRAGAKGIAAIRLFQDPMQRPGLDDFISRLHSIRWGGAAG